MSLVYSCETAARRIGISKPDAFVGTVENPLPNLRLGSARTAPTGRALRFHPSVRARRSRFRSPHTSPAKCLRIPRSRLRTVHWTVQSGFAGPCLTPPTGRGPHGAGQRMQSIRVTDGAKACLRGVGASLPAPRFGRGGPCLGHLIHPRRNACAFRVRDFEQSTGLFNPASPDRLSPPPTRGGSADAKHPRNRQSEGLPSRSRRFASHPSVWARRALFRSPHNSPAKCLHIPRSALRTVHWTVQSGFAEPRLTPANARHRPPV